MFGKDASKRFQIMVATATLLAGGALVTFADQARADYAEILGAERTTLRNPLIPGADYTNPMQAAPQGQPPPIGDGPNPLPVTPGDQGGPVPPSSGQADPTHGNIFPTRNGGGPKPPWEYVQNAGRHDTQAGRQQGVFDNGQEMNGTGTTNNGGARAGARGLGSGGKMNGTATANNGGARGGATGTTNNGGALNNANGFGPGGEEAGTRITNNGGALQNSTDLVNNGGPRPDARGQSDRLFAHQNQPNRYNFGGPLPTVRTFSRYLVILGCVSATIFVALASMAMILGSPYGGSRVIGAAGGLLLLLGGYTIWKIVQMNTFHANSIGWESHYRNGQPQPLNPANPRGNNPNNGPFLPPQNPLNNGGGANNPGPFNAPNANGTNNGGFNNGGFNNSGFDPNGAGGFGNGGFDPNGGGGPIPNPPVIFPNGGFFGPNGN
jgi:hypothetical protein